MIAAAVYLLCALTSVMCAVLLLVKYRQSGLRLLFWSGLCFVGLATNNVLLVIDLVVVPDVDLSTIRIIPSVLGLALLVWGFIWDTERT